jgi:predicted NACHT family NTPase
VPEFEYRQLPAQDVRLERIIKDIAVQRGLLVAQAEGIYSFSHLTLHEYFTAQYILDKGIQRPLSQLMKHVDVDRLREVFLLLKGMLGDSYNFDLFTGALRQMISEELPVVQLLRWVEGKSKQVQTTYKSPAVRAFYLSLSDLDHAPDYWDSPKKVDTQKRQIEYTCFGGNKEKTKTGIPGSIQRTSSQPAA